MSQKQVNPTFGFIVLLAILGGVVYYLRQELYKKPGDAYTAYTTSIEKLSDEISGKKVVAICTNESDEISNDEEAAIAEWKQQLSLKTGIKFVTRNQLEKIMQEHQFQLSDWSSEEKTAEVGKALNASALVTFMPSSSQMQIININTFEKLELQADIFTDFTLDDAHYNEKCSAMDNQVKAVKLINRMF